ncbi:MAG: hypothetical protein LBK23_08140 [Oscillospiraceae bacterium]|jgi:hypothetical protein|nr:hypothetical protein [Oscillospiraceae bacterium]
MDKQEYNWEPVKDKLTELSADIIAFSPNWHGRKVIAKLMECLDAVQGAVVGQAQDRHYEKLEQERLELHAKYEAEKAASVS